MLLIGEARGGLKIPLDLVTSSSGDFGKGKFSGMVRTKGENAKG